MYPLGRVNFRAFQQWLLKDGFLENFEIEKSISHSRQWVKEHLYKKDKLYSDNEEKENLVCSLIVHLKKKHFKRTEKKVCAHKTFTDVM